MSKKEEFTSPIKCNSCGLQGTACCEENENPVHGAGLDTKVGKVSEGFKKVSGNKIICISCEKQVWYEEEMP
jgi:hypothetical protein